MELTYAQVKELHKYYTESNSLQKTSERCMEMYGCEINRHQLSRLFRSHDLYVKPPNGRPEIYWRDLKVYSSPVSHLCSVMIDNAFGDLTGYNVTFLDYLTACAFIGSDMWQLMLGTVLNASINVQVNSPLALMNGVNLENALTMRELYDEAYHYWVESVGDRRESE